MPNGQGETAADYAHAAAHNAGEAAKTANRAAATNEARLTALLGVLRAKGLISAEDAVLVMRGGH